MTPIENLHYAIGEIAYAVAHADGAIQKEEREKFHNIVEAELRNKDYAFDISDIIFQIMDKDKKDSKSVYDAAMHQIKVNSHYLSPKLKQTFIKVMQKVAKAYPPVTPAEQELMLRFEHDIQDLVGDPVYYGTN
ncbi:MAG: TerB family tellurite resistance protein [Bacteroidota bacterium]|nr:TerB family tellurite resistance protein [Bacteroidota bacterium]